MFLPYNFQHVLAIKSCFSWIKCQFVSLWTITIDSHGALYQLRHFRHNKRGFTLQIKSYIASNSHSSFASTLAFPHSYLMFLPIFPVLYFSTGPSMEWSGRTRSSEIKEHHFTGLFRSAGLALLPKISEWIPVQKSTLTRDNS